MMETLEATQHIEDSLNVSRLITEEDLIDSLFYTCDVKGFGKVSVSKLIEYLRFTTSSLSSENELDELLLLLDPDRLDVCVDITTYRECIAQWIQKIRERNQEETEHGIYGPMQSSPHKSAKPFSINELMNCSHISAPSFGSLEASGCANNDDPNQDVDDLINQVKDLQHHNRKLTDENTKLKTQLEVGEESCQSLSQDIEQLRKKLHSMQQFVTKGKEIEQENLEMKSTLSSLEENYKYLEKKFNQLQKEKSLLNGTIEQLQEQLQQSAITVESVKKHEEELQTSLTEQKTAYRVTQELQNLQESKLKERTGQFEEMGELIDQLSRINDNLKKEKVELESQLDTTQHHLNSILMHGRDDIDAVDNNQSLTDNHNNSKLIPSACSTPFAERTPSLRIELEDKLHDNLPNPFCDKDLMECPYDDTEEDIDKITKPSQFDHIVSKAVEMAKIFKKRKEEILEEITNLSKPRYGFGQHIKQEPTEPITVQIGQLVENAIILTTDRTHSTKRIEKLVAIVKRLKEDKLNMEQVYCEEMEKIKSEALQENTSFLEKLRQIEQLLDKERDYTNQLESQIKCTDKKLEETVDRRKEVESKLGTVINERNKLDIDLRKLKSSKTELTEDSILAKDQIADLQIALKKSETENKRNEQLHQQLQQELRTNSEKQKRLFHDITTLLVSVGGSQVENPDSLKVNIENAFQQLQDQIIQLQAAYTSVKSQYIVSLDLKRTSKEGFSTCINALSLEGHTRFVSTDRADLPTRKRKRTNSCICLSTSTSTSVQSTSTQTTKSTPCSSYTQTDLTCEELDTAMDAYDQSGRSSKNTSATSGVDLENSLSSAGSIVSEQLSAVANNAISSFQLKLTDPCNTVPVHKNSLSVMRSYSSRKAILTKEYNHSFENSSTESSHEQEGSDTPVSGSEHKVALVDTRSSTPVDPDSGPLPVLIEEDSLEGDVPQVNGTNRPEIGKLVRSTAVHEPLVYKQPPHYTRDKQGVMYIQSESVPEKCERWLQEKKLAIKRKASVSSDEDSPSEAQFSAELNKTIMAALTEQDARCKSPSKMSSSILVEQTDTREQTTPLTPNVNSSVLRMLGLSPSNNSNRNGKMEMSEKELEEKFSALALAFKTDKLTIEERLNIRKRTRDIMENNILNVLKETRKDFAEFSYGVLDTENSDLFQRIQHHLDVLQQSSVKMSSCAEVHGAVQQESRICVAVEIMVAHVENLKRLYEKEHTELEETKKLINENKVLHHSFSTDLGDSLLARRSGSSLVTRRSPVSSPRLQHRSYTIAQSQSIEQTGTRRRASMAAVPRMLGGQGGASLIGTRPLFDVKEPTIEKDEDEDARERFQCMVASATVKNTITGIMRRASLEKHRATDLHPEPHSESNAESNGSVVTLTVPSDKLDEISQDDQQDDRSSSYSDEDNAQETVPDVIPTARYVKQKIIQLYWKLQDNFWDKVTQRMYSLHNAFTKPMLNRILQIELTDKKVRMFVASCLMFVAFLTILYTILPTGTAARSREVWTSLEEALWPAVGKRYIRTPPI